MVGIRAWGVAGIVSIIPTTDDVAAVLEPEPYEEIEPVVISSIRDMASLATVEAVEGCTVSPVTPAQNGREEEDVFGQERTCSASRVTVEAGPCPRYSRVRLWGATTRVVSGRET